MHIHLYPLWLRYIVMFACLIFSQIQQFLSSQLATETSLSVVCDTVSICSHLVRTSPSHVALVQKVFRGKSGGYLHFLWRVTSKRRQTVVMARRHRREREQWQKKWLSYRKKTKSSIIGKPEEVEKLQQHNQWQQQKQEMVNFVVAVGSKRQKWCLAASLLR